MTNKFEKNQLDQINEVSIFTPIIQAILKRKTNKKARELQKDPKLSASYKNMEDAIHGFMRSMDVFLDSSSKMLGNYGEGEEKTRIDKQLNKQMKSFGPEVYKKWKKIRKK